MACVRVAARLSTVRHGFGRGHHFTQAAALGSFRTFSVAPDAVEFTLHPYSDRPELGYERGTDFCMLTLRHPAFEHPAREQPVGTNAASAPLSGLFRRAREERANYVRDLFHQHLEEGETSLDLTRLRPLLTHIQMPPNDLLLQDLKQRYEGGAICLKTFEKIVTEAWGHPPDIQYSDRLADLHAIAQGAHAPIEGPRALLFVGRQSPAFWALRGLRNMWPRALVSVQILRSSDEVLMTSFFDAPIPGLKTIDDLVQKGEKDALKVRLVTLEGETIDLPLRCLPENITAGVVGSASRWLSGLFGGSRPEYVPPAAAA
eukprot:TRINITY_DN38642_c0_g1_i1.p1 TRINITY_DN38642_c0_g1~~TRINITY_DN38642_c0_g1_i1.p1  ORF type:complete len:317 (+),score=50.82 TRINITY_DN38642_c0_g1_i1:87-1037(+)